MSNIVRALKRKLERKNNFIPRIRSNETKNRLITIADSWARANITRGDSLENIKFKMPSEDEKDIKEMCKLVERHHVVFDRLYALSKREIAKEKIDIERDKEKVIEVTDADLKEIKNDNG